jgi:hypothetical protein
MHVSRFPAGAPARQEFHADAFAELGISATFDCCNSILAMNYAYVLLACRLSSYTSRQLQHSSFQKTASNLCKKAPP